MAENPKKFFIIDASFILSFLLRENQKEVDDIFLRYQKNEIELHSSSLLKFEVGNGLKTAVLRKRISRNIARLIYQTFLKLEIKEETIDWVKTLTTAITKHLSFYDASYLTLAKHLHYSLLTMDSSLKS